MSCVRALVMTGFGINCEEELAAAFRLAGAEAKTAHLNELFLERVHLADYQILALPGGFSFGDDLGSGKVLANKLRYKRLASGEPFFETLRSFLDHGGFVFGVCNGFQVLVKLGLLPNIGGNFEQEVTLARNDSGRFEDRWCECVVNGEARSPILEGISRIRLPVRHGEGRLVVRDQALRDAIVEGGLSCLVYCDESGMATNQYPANPNGADLACAAMQDRSGQIFGMMPHPEAALTLYNDPGWPELKRAGAASEEGQGLQLFRNLVRHVAKRAAEG